MDILGEIVEKRKQLIREKGFGMGVDIPEKRNQPLSVFVRDPFLVCEIKRKSPSKGAISAGLDAKTQAGVYHSNGVRSVSVLTEPNYFGGSLRDLMEVKQAFPGLAVLRKDFLTSIEEIDISFRAGADAVLLIASILTEEEISGMYARAKSLGMEVLVEVHTKEDVEKVKSFEPVLTGINARDLVSFRVDLAIPLLVRQYITWKTDLLFESGIHAPEDAAVALGSGFRGMLVGESVVRDPGLVSQLLAAFSVKRRNFWERLYQQKQPFVKICGITNIADAEHADACGADILGFIFAPSKRRAEPGVVEKCASCSALKIGVVMTPPGITSLEPAVKQLQDDGLLDAIQFHGSETPEQCFSIAFPYYKVIPLRTIDDIDTMKLYRSPRILVDAFSESGQGGTGKSIPGDIIDTVRKQYPLWLAGGLGADNIKTVIDRFSPELVDAASRLEESPGKKDHTLVEKFIRAVKG